MERAIDKIVILARVRSGLFSCVGLETHAYSRVPLYTGSVVPRNGFGEEIVEGIE